MERTTLSRGRVAVAAHFRPMIATTGGAFWSTTETLNPPSVRAAEAFRTMLGTSSGWVVS